MYVRVVKITSMGKRLRFLFLGILLLLHVHRLTNLSMLSRGLELLRMLIVSLTLFVKISNF